jgi:hypothetical protein
MPQIDLTAVLIGMDDKPLKKDENTDLTLNHVISNALMADLQSTKALTKEDKNKLYDLWFDKIRKKKKADVTIDELKMIDDRIAEAYPQLISGQCSRILNK